VGAKSGKPRVATLGYLDEPDGSRLLIASVMAAKRNPGWRHNLARQPEATIELADGSRIPVRAETVQGADLDAAWARIAADAPEYVRYRPKTDRELAVIRLRPR
jgi:deazaflavin-dependent oxidoreductase (nitroreductase family)